MNKAEINPAPRGAGWIETLMAVLFGFACQSTADLCVSMKPAARATIFAPRFENNRGVGMLISQMRFDCSLSKGF
jgi:hypothetical protein